VGAVADDPPTGMAVTSSPSPRMAVVMASNNSPGLSLSTTTGGVSVGEFVETQLKLAGFSHVEVATLYCVESGQVYTIPEVEPAEHQ
jgi:hypothetical protein